jgi:hypothetical protein
MMQATMDSISDRSEDLLPEDEEIIDDDTPHAVVAAKSPEKKTGSARVISKSTRERTRGVGKSTSMSVGGHSRPRARRTPSCGKLAGDSDWGNSSQPKMALSDLLGGDKKSMGGGGARSSASVGGTPASNLLKHRYPKTRGVVDDKTKNARRLEVKNSLSHFLHANQPDTSDVEEEEEEDESLISDEGDKEENSDIEKSDGERSQKSSKSRSKRTRKPRRTGGGGGDDVSVVSSASRMHGNRRRKKADADDATVGTVDSRMSRRTKGLPVGPVKPMRVQGERQKRSKDTLVPRKKTSKTDKEEGTADGEEDKKPPRPRKKHSNTESDDVSVSSRKSKSGRRKKRTSDSSRKKPQSPTKPKEDGTGTAPSSPECPTGDRKSPSSGIKVKVSSLSDHIETDPVDREAKDPEEASEESSHFSHEYSDTLLQFDPTNENHVTFVTQSGAHVTSEKIRLENGKESELQIHDKLTGLPTFETQPIYLDNSACSGLSVDDDLAASQASLESHPEELHEDQEQAKRGRSSNRTIEAAAAQKSADQSAAAQSAGEKSESDERIGEEELVDEKETTGKDKAKIKRSFSPGRLRGVTGGRSFLNRRNKDTEEGEEKPNSEKHNSAKSFGFFGRAKKKDESDSDGEEVEKDRFGRKKRKPKNLAHQALDDDGSD